MTFGAVVQRLHLWAGVLLGIQVTLWMLSGVVMSWFHLDLVRGERSMFQAPPPELEAINYASPGGVIAQMDGAQAVELRYFLGRPVYEVKAVDGYALFDARTGTKISPIDEETARAVAKQDYIGDGEIVALSLMTQTPQEYRRDLPVWRADFDDRLNTRLYISPNTGQVVSRRNDVWRLYDFFWMLHIMDYGERVDFNNPLVKAASAAGFLFALTGLIMVIMKKGRRQIKQDLAFVFRRGGRKKGA